MPNDFEHIVRRYALPECDKRMLLAVNYQARRRETLLAEIPASTGFDRDGFPALMFS